MLRIYIECHPNENIRSAHLSIPVTPEPFSRYSDTKPERAQLLENVLRKQVELRIDAMGGVNWSEISFERNKAFSWEQAITKFVDTLGKFYNQRPEVEIMERNPEWDKPRDERDDDIY